MLGGGNDFAALKRKGRHELHRLMAVPCAYTEIATGQVITTYPDAETGIELPLTCRWHSKLATSGIGIESSGLQIITGINRLVFDADQLQAAGIDPASGDQVSIPGYALSENGSPAMFQLDNEMPSDGPVNVYWSVVTPSS